MTQLKNRVLELLEKKLTENEIVSELLKEGFKRDEIEKTIEEVLLEKIIKSEEEKAETEEKIEKESEEKKDVGGELEKGLKELEKYMKEEKVERGPKLPVFIKVEKYIDVVETIERIKNKMDVLEKNLNVLKEIDDLRKEVFENFKTLLSATLLEIINLEGVFVKSEEIESLVGKKEIKEEELAERFEGLVKELKSKLQDIKKSIDQL